MDCLECREQFLVAPGRLDWMIDLGHACGAVLSTATPCGFPWESGRMKLDIKHPKCSISNIFWKIICATSESSLPKLSSKTFLVQGTERYNRKWVSNRGPLRYELNSSRVQSLSWNCSRRGVCTRARARRLMVLTGRKRKALTATHALTISEQGTKVWKHRFNFPFPSKFLVKFARHTE